MCDSYPFQPMEIAKSIVNAFESIPEPKGPGSTSKWTRAVKQGIGQLASDDRNCFFTDSGGEICLDVTVWCGTSLLLGVECEWAYKKVSEIARDFKKLLGCCDSPIRLMITDSGADCYVPYSEAILAMLSDHHHRNLDLYLWLDIHGDLDGGGRIVFHEWRPDQAGLPPKDKQVEWLRKEPLLFRFLQA